MVCIFFLFMEIINTKYFLTKKYKIEFGGKIRMKKIKIILILIILLIIFIFTCAYSYVSAISDNLYNSVFRLHVIANSDSEEDQNLKYIVRDSIINYMNDSCKNLSTKDEIIEYAKKHLDEIKMISEKTVEENGFNYPITVEIGNFEFPTKNYGDISFPCGFYDALRVKIGNSSGKNWWCVMFPPLCFIDTTTGTVPDSSKESLQETLSNENYKIVSENDNSEITIKFKIIEFFEKNGIITAKN